MSIIAADGFKISKVNTPTREGERIATIADITNREKVPNPSVGMIIFVEDEKEHYKVLSLAPATIGGVKVSNAVVKEYCKLTKEISDTLIEKTDALSARIAKLAADIPSSSGLTAEYDEETKTLTLT